MRFSAGVFLVLFSQVCFSGCESSTCPTDTFHFSTDDITLEWEVEQTCSACGHAQLDLTWTVPQPVTIKGDVSVVVQIKCGNGAIAQPDPAVTAPATDLKMTVKPNNAKNLWATPARRITSSRSRTKQTTSF